MKYVLRGLLLVLLALVIATPGSAQEKKEKKKRPDRGDRAGAAFRLPRSVNLTAEQKDELAKLQKKYGAKLQEAQKKMALTADQRTARAAAVKEARDAGKKGKELREAVSGAVNLTAEQQDAQKAMRALQQEVRQAVLGLLTDEQRSQLRGPGKDGKGEKKRRKKSDA